jgi:hypothetical protein
MRSALPQVAEVAEGRKLQPVLFCLPDPVAVFAFAESGNLKQTDFLAELDQLNFLPLAFGTSPLAAPSRVCPLCPVAAAPFLDFGNGAGSQENTSKAKPLPASRNSRKHKKQ